ncbi:hypothetical protein M6B38_118520 [Iris pallida]|uniref:Uncharacterized protein n=1 Tax=Iris pallida TaxID=29817 RepID=A0AAX6HIA8_IRIPA|nr:hypothetical protein M6B38_118520 [Iris pallida]
MTRSNGSSSFLEELERRSKRQHSLRRGSARIKGALGLQEWHNSRGGGTDFENCDNRCELLR